MKAAKRKASALIKELMPEIEKWIEEGYMQVDIHRHLQESGRFPYKIGAFKNQYYKLRDAAISIPTDDDQNDSEISHQNNNKIERSQSEIIPIEALNKTDSSYQDKLGAAAFKQAREG